MRTTVTLDPDTEAVVRRLMAQRGVSFKRALNDAIRAGTSPSADSEPHAYTRPRELGVPTVDLTHALRLAAESEDEELVKRMQAGR
ncbi:antitoxin [Microbacterium protaetiae]|uniref:Antitoxin n=1 Tax=Microbacterium protaetiae TaxID=2509458 RepID=A0A4P6EFC8_9MICO|nr:antitoxin [Microbacterium protaetiae]QAY60506.1 antitoxin [Microbacterium protaetiae]